MIDFGDVREAALRLEGVAHRTPVVTSRTLDGRAGAQILCKAENLQRTGSFKIRGAYNRICQLDDDERRRGVIAYSSGNHAQAVALAARMVDSHAVIVMPDNAPAAKREATDGYGAEIVSYDPRDEEREAIADEIAHARGLTIVPPYDHPAVMAGQGTAALELIQDAGPLDVLVVPVGGGGLIAGSATAAAELCPGARIVGVEPETADDTRRSLETGERVRIPIPKTVADGLRAPTPGALTFEVNRRLVHEVVTVSDGEILEAMGFLLDRLKLLVEPSGACAVAALLAGKVRAEDARVGVILSGGNVGAKHLVELLAGAPSG